MHKTDRDTVKTILQDCSSFILQDCPRGKDFLRYLETNYADMLDEIFRETEQTTIGFLKGQSNNGKQYPR